MNTSNYLISPDLKAAVEVSISLGVPLLLTGEPGTGKTQLATYVAEQMLKTDLLRFNTKTTSKAKDILYQYQALTHFRDSQRGEQDINTLNYITFRALGKAILESSQRRYVVLIDEIDKAPRDFPNDILFEFESLKFAIDEASPEELTIWASQLEHAVQMNEQGILTFDEQSNHKPVLILTSNSEKNLPDAFLRRCAYYHIPFPDKAQLIDIVNANEPLNPAFSKKMLEAAIDHFIKIREQGLSKRPATAELLAWIHILNENGIDVAKTIDGNDESIQQKLKQTYILLAKNKEDRERLMGMY